MVELFISDYYDRGHRRNDLSGKRCGTINDELPNIQRYLHLFIAFNLVICIEFVKMLCKHTPDTLVEVMMFAIARQMIVEHTESTAESSSSFIDRDIICNQEITFWKV